MDILWLLMVACAAMVRQYQVLAQQVEGMIVCYAQKGCVGTDLGSTTRRDCCVGNALGQSFQIPGGEICTDCVVFGFFNVSFTGMEQESSYSVQAGYQKGADVAAKNLAFQVMARDGTARKGSNLDYTVNTADVVSLFSTPVPPDNVEFTLNVDDIALESNETFSLQLVPSADTTLPTGEGVFFLDTLSVTIIDNDIPQFFIFPANMMVGEETDVAQVCINLDGTLDDTVVVSAETQTKTGATNQATAGSDYEPTSFQVTFEPTTPTQICWNISIFDDVFDEPPEEFSVLLSDAVPSGEFRIRESCITILDNDIPVISLTAQNIEVSERDAAVRICITIDGLLARNIVVKADTVPKAGATNQATAGADYRTTQITVTFEPGTESMQTKCDTVEIIDDDVDEPDEQFAVRLTSATPDGNLREDETCITIIDDDQSIPVCHGNADLTNFGEIPVCVCRPGFTGDGITSCDDIDECSEMTDGCSENANCVNTVGSFECVCKPGYTGDGVMCDDIDECATNDVCDDFVTCSNLRGGYRCMCTQDDGTTCITKTMRTGTPTRTETKSSGSSRKKRAISSRSTSESRSRSRSSCGCRKGYTLDPNGQTCIDVNECETGNNDCNLYVKCVNLPGTFKCVCNSCNTMYKKRRRPKITHNMKWTKSRKKRSPWRK